MEDHKSESANPSIGPYAAVAALASLVEACGGEVEEVFSGEIGNELRSARELLSRYKGQTVDPWQALSSEIGRIDSDFPNHGDWPIDLPAGHWRAILEDIGLKDT